jgi:membrane-associated HD superfamily phosphohydrolase
MIHTNWFVRSIGVVVALALGSGMAAADSKGDLSSRKSDWDQVKRRMEETSKRVENYLEASRKIRAMDKSELDALITQICKLDIARNDDEADRLAKSLSDKVIENVRREYDNINSEADRLGGGDVERVINDAKSLRDSTKSLASDEDAEVKDDAQELLREMSDTIDGFTERIFEKFEADYRTLTNLKEGVMNGSNNPRIRAAMEYGKEKHTYNQQICEEKELSLSSGRPDCVSFQKDNCLVWEFKPDTYSESEAKSQAERYLRDVQDRFKDDSRALENCKKDSDGKPIFEAKGVTYPACRP